MTNDEKNYELNVLHLIDNLDSNAISENATELSRQEKQYGVNPFVAGKFGILAYNLERAKVPYFDINFKSINIIKTISKLKKIIKENHIKIIHTHSVRTAFFGYFLTNKTKIKLITEYNKYQEFKKYDIMKIMYKILLKGDACIVPSNYLKEYISETYKTPKNEIKIIPHSINTDFYTPTKITAMREMEFLQKYNIHLEKKLITIIGEIDINNGFDDLITLAKEINRKDYSFIIASKNFPKDSSVKEYKQLIKNFRIEDRIAIIENMTDLAELLKTSHCYYSPATKASAFNREILLANAMHRPVIAIDTGATKEYLNNKTSILVKAGDIKSQAEKICKILDMKISDWEELQQECDKFAEKFSIKNTANECIKIYKSLF